MSWFGLSPGVCICMSVYVYESVRVCAHENVYDLPQ